MATRDPYEGPDMAAMSGAEKTRAYRERLRSRGLREIRLFVPDTRDPEM
jgi:hypothetical protein